MIKRTLLLGCLVFWATLPGMAQSLSSGEIAGSVSDPSGAVVLGATVALKSRDTGTSQNTKTNSDGAYRFGLLKPGRYTLAIEANGFQTSQRNLELSVGQTLTASFKLELGQASQRVDITTEQTLINPDPSNNTTFTSTPNWTCCRVPVETLRTSPLRHLGPS